MTIDIGWSIILNNTDLDWTDLQHALKNILKYEMLHCLPKGNMEIMAKKQYLDGVEYDVYGRLKDDHVEFAVILVGSDEI